MPYNCKCGIIYVVRFVLKTITCRTHYSFSSYAVYTFALVLLHHFPVRHFPVLQIPPLQIRPSFSSPAISTPATSSVIFQSCKIHPLFFDGPSFSSPANSSHPHNCTMTKMANIFVLGNCAAVAVGVVNRRNRVP